MKKYQMVRWLGIVALFLGFMGTGCQMDATSSFENSLGMKFVPVPGTRVLFSVWETRVRDFRAYAEATGYEQKRGVIVWQENIGEWVLDEGASWEKPGFAQSGDHAVVGVIWDEAKEFCEWLTNVERAAGRIGAMQAYRLPTDEEWSVAVGETTYPWGNEWPPQRGAGNYAPSLKVDDYEHTSPVGSFAPNRYGLYDMGGNVWEWCKDRYQPSMNTGEMLEAYPFLKATDGGLGNQRGMRLDSRVVRGGSWFMNGRAFMSSSYRGHYSERQDLVLFIHQGARFSSLGFRCVLVDGTL